MKLVAIVEKVNNKRNKNLVGKIVVVESKLKGSMDNELCYREEWNDDVSDRDLLQCFGMYHSISNIEIIGVL